MEDQAVVRDQEALTAAVVDTFRPLVTLARMDQLRAICLRTPRAPRILKVILRAKMVYSTATVTSAVWSHVEPVGEMAVPEDLVALMDVVWGILELLATLVTRASPHVKWCSCKKII